VPDIIKVEILEDGTVKTTTDPISGPNHQSAESFMRSMTTFLGGLMSRTKRNPAAKQHHHHHVENKQ
jgi:hypothetical protein